MYFEVLLNKTKLILKVGDITLEDTEAIVNAANPSLLGGGGVDGRIHSVGGPKILEECKKIGGCKPGNAVITSGGNLRAKFVIHTVGPIYGGGAYKEDLILKNAYTNSLLLAKEKGIVSISFPSISTGAYGYPVDMAATIAMQAVIDFIKKHTELNEIRFVLFKEHIFTAYKNALEKIINA